MFRKRKWKYILNFNSEYDELIKKNIIEMIYPGKLSIEKFDGKDVEYAKAILMNTDGDLETKYKEVILPLLQIHV